MRIARLLLNPLGQHALALAGAAEGGLDQIEAPLQLRHDRRRLRLLAGHDRIDRALYVLLHLAQRGLDELRAGRIERLQTDQLGVEILPRFGQRLPHLAFLLRVLQQNRRVELAAVMPVQIDRFLGALDDLEPAVLFLLRLLLGLVTLDQIAEQQAGAAEDRQQRQEKPKQSETDAEL